MTEEPKAKAESRGRLIFQTLDGVLLDHSEWPPWHRDVLESLHGYTVVEGVRVRGRNDKISTLKKARVVRFDPTVPLGGKSLKPGPDSPICQKCGLFNICKDNPFMEYEGAENPKVTVMLDGVTHAEAQINKLGARGFSAMVWNTIAEVINETGIPIKDVRWVPMTRCAGFQKGKAVDLKTKANYCRWFAIQDLIQHPPKLIIPVGTTALGRLSHKSNAQDWAGKLLTFRGWPDEWLTTPDFVFPKVHGMDRELTLTGHPVFGPVPTKRTPMFPVQHPRIILAEQSSVSKKQFKKQITQALALVKSGVEPMNYVRPWYRFTEDIDQIIAGLSELVAHPGLLVCYDTETTGLKPWAKDAAIVSMMFRWVDPETKEPRSLGFPWNTDNGAVQPYIEDLQPLVWQVLCQSKLIGHNLTFDVLYTYGTFYRKGMAGWDDPQHNLRRDELLCALADAAHFDTWHMAYTQQQKRGSLGLEVVTYNLVPDLAGYEEEMTLLIDLHYDMMHPAANKGGHYLNCPKDKWQSHLVPYVMGDVETCYRAYERLVDKLSGSPVYKFPLARPDGSGKFRWFTPPSREWVYSNIMSPASRMLQKLMGRGLYVDVETLAQLEVKLPNEIVKTRQQLREATPAIAQWVTAKENTNPDWEFDLDNKSVLRDLLFNELKLTPHKLTKGGQKLFGETLDDAIKSITLQVHKQRPELTPDDLTGEVMKKLIEFASVDKFTLNRMAVDNPEIRPLLDYRKRFKLWSTYVQTLRNPRILPAELHKSVKDRATHLWSDSCTHASFMLTGTRGGRLSCRDPNLQQLPRDGEVKEMFTSRFGKRGCLYQGDLSQIELRLMAAACGDQTMIKAYFDKVDLHSLTTSRIFGVPYEHFSKDYMKSLQKAGKDKEAKELDLNRSIGKTINFLTGYGGGAFGLQNVLAGKAIYKDIEFCESLIQLFFESYPALRDLLSYYKRFIEENAVAVSIFGRVRIFEEMFSDDEQARAKALRAGCNHLIQSTASDMMLLALIVIEQMMREAQLESILVSTVHDSLVIDAIQTELPQVHDIVISVLNNFDIVLPTLFGPSFDTSWMLVPFTGDCEIGMDYLHTKKIPEQNVDWDELLHPKVEAA